MPRQNKIVIRNGTTTPNAADFDTAEPAWDKTAGKLYIKDGAGSMVEVGAGGGGGLTHFVESESTAAPNATVPVDALTATDASYTNIDVALVAKGTGATLAQVPDGTSAGGNKRGQYATDWQKFRTATTHVSSGDYATIGGGRSNTASFTTCTVGGGDGNRASGNTSTVAGGYGNISTALTTTIGGGFQNTASSSYATVSGGTTNTASGNSSSVGGGNTNTASSSYSFVGGGQSNEAKTNTHATCVGGSDNDATGGYSFVGGGQRNTASNLRATIGGGIDNTASGSYAVIAGGQNNTASGSPYGVVVGGYQNTASGPYSFVGGGNNNTASGNYAFIGGGSLGTTRLIQGNHVFPACHAPIASTQGVTQSALLLLARQTTDATATVLTSNSSAASTTNQVILPNNSAYYFRGSAISGVTGGGDSKAWTFEGAIKRGANAASTAIVGTVIINTIAQDVGAAAWTIAITADTTNGGIAVTFTGAAATTIRTVAKIETTEMTY